MLQVGIIGLGFMGMIHYLAYQRVPGVRVAAICSRDLKKLSGDWRGIQGNFGPRGQKVNLAGVRTYKKIDDTLADLELDLIDICLPPALHCNTSISALRAGKHVFCEKPIGLTALEAKKMLSAAQTVRRQLLIGHVLPFFPEYAFALAAAQSGRFGKLLGGHFKRVIADNPGRDDYFNPRTVGGPLLDLHIHDAHLIRLLFGMPHAVFSRGRIRGSTAREKTAEYVETQFIYADPAQVVSATAGVIRQQGRSFNQAFEFHFQRATLAYDFAVQNNKPHLATPLTVLDANGNVQRPKLGSPEPADAFVAEIRAVVQSVTCGTPSKVLSGSLAADAVLLCQRQAQSLCAGRLVKV